mmetsp:Transcript_21125/g.54911  ORF Transcript_21125/g.54911 Transcript_21125/m.54911 type:complete len:1044 (-) Transcript_21125:293-3424(-)
MSLIDAWDIDSGYGNEEEIRFDPISTAIKKNRATSDSFGGREGGSDGGLERGSSAAEFEGAAHILQEEKPVFRFESSLWRKLMQKLRDMERIDITCASAENGNVVFASQGRLIFWSSGSDALQEIRHKMGDGSKVSKLCLDSSGSHLLLLFNGEIGYCNVPAGKVKSISQLKGVPVTSAVWDTDTSGEVKEALVGTRDGKIWKVQIEGKDRSAKMVYDIGEKMSLIGMELERFPKAKSGTKFYVMAASATRYFQFIGGPTLEEMFAGYDMNAPFRDVPSEGSKAALHAFRKHGKARIQNFAWLNGAGIYCGRFLFSDQVKGEGTVGHDDLCPHPESDESAFDVASTEFHFILLYRTKVIVINQLSQEVVLEKEFDGGESRSVGRAILHDAGQGRYLLVRSNCIDEIYVEDEERDVWWLYLKKRDFNEALQHCNNLRQRNRVLVHQANYLFSQCKYESAAQAFAKTDLPFEEVTLKFIHEGQEDALRVYLVHKMDNISNADKTQLTLISTWLLEMHLNKLNTVGVVESSDEYDADEDVVAVKHFLADVKEYLDPTTAYHMISTRGHMKLWLFFADLLEDRERAITYYLQHQAYDKCLQALNSARNPDLYYKYSPALMAKHPSSTVDAWIEAGTVLDPRKLITAMLPLDLRTGSEGGDEMEDRQFELMDQAIRYLEHVVTQGGCEDAAVHNFLITMYALRNREDAIIKQLETRDDSVAESDIDDEFGLDALKFGLDDMEEEGGEDKPASKKIDLKYALRICNRRGKKKACMVIYSHLGLYDEAVALALAENDLNTARTFVSKAKDVETKRSLWLQIVKHVINDVDGVNKVIELISETKLISIEDVLPFFPDSILIDDFKDHICEALERYNKGIEALNKKMEEATKGAERIRTDLKMLRNRSNYVSGAQRCEITDERIGARPFAVFPCGHVALEDALFTFVEMRVSDDMRIRMDDLRRKLKHGGSGRSMPTTPHVRELGDEAMKRQSNADSMQMPDVVDMTTAECKIELEGVLTAECPACGEYRIESIDQPFVSAGDVGEEKLWRL